MRENLLFVITLILSAFMYSCDLDGDGVIEPEIKTANFPAHIQEMGESVANGINIAVNHLNEMGVDYSDAENTEVFRGRFMDDLSKVNPLITKNSELNPTNLDAETIIERIGNLTEIQLIFIRRIIKECDESSTVSEFLNKLVEINEDIYSSVPKIEQERLFYVTSILYYGYKEIYGLEKQGIMIRSSDDDIKFLKVKSQTEVIDLGRCKKIVSTVWMAALVEPSPFGEALATAVTLYVGGMIIYEYLVCRDSASSSNCIDLFTQCVTYRWQQDCSTCLSNCIVQGSWPRWMCPL